MHTSFNKRGFTLFFALLISSLALAIGLAIYDLTVREIDLSATVKQSQYAIYAADTGAECALYWDAKGYNPGSTGIQTAFATSSTYLGAGQKSGLYCNGIDITDPALSSWGTGTPTASAATTTFMLTFLPQVYCATVVVAKVGNPPTTVITSSGFNTCASGGPLQLQRTLQVSY